MGGSLAVRFDVSIPAPEDHLSEGANRLITFVGEREREMSLPLAVNISISISDTTV